MEELKVLLITDEDRIKEYDLRDPGGTALDEICKQQYGHSISAGVSIVLEFEDHFIAVNCDESCKIKACSFYDGDPYYDIFYDHYVDDSD